MTVPCWCDPTLDYGPNNPECPRHGAEVLHWQDWGAGKRRCPYCEGLDEEDFVACCDCWRYEQEQQEAGKA